MNILQKLVKSIAISLIIFIVCSFLVINPAFAKNIPAGFGEGVKIATPNGDIAVENLKKGDRVIGYNFETHRDRENVVKEKNSILRLVII